jgi:hypothetical protein
MKLEKQQTAIYEAEVKSFKDFYELKCNLPGLITGEDIEVRDDLYPKAVSYITAIPLDYEIDMTLWFESVLGSYPVSIKIIFLSGYTIVTFDSTIEKSEPNKKLTKTEYLSKKEFNDIQSKCLPVIETFLDTLDGIERNKPCEIDCYYNEQRKKNNGGCDKIYISKSEYTPEKDAWKQRITLAREQINKNKYNF